MMTDTNSISIVIVITLLVGAAVANLCCFCYCWYKSWYKRGDNDGNRGWIVSTGNFANTVIYQNTGLPIAINTQHPVGNSECLHTECVSYEPGRNIGLGMHNSLRNDDAQRVGMRTNHATFSGQNFRENARPESEGPLVDWRLVENTARPPPA
ncbi:hypothetical protein DPMN_045685 [Dreissena polymorpha]|uniref:Uncharacterized protein n=1 Tax=Dreissena polymorpha TaxID=45954 RepID=A0A9D4D6L1_DREPO|nr:hypothetical protein DPMN_045685 [Dreissena polymorpha]